MNKARVIVNNKHDISDLVDKMTWAGDMDQAARTLSFPMATIAGRVEDGDKIRVYYNDRNIFNGIVTSVEIDPASKTCSVKAHDLGLYLMKNKVFGVFKGTPQKITRMVAAKLGLETGMLAERAESTKVTSTGDQTAWDVIQTAYEGEEGKRQYVLYIKNGKICTEKAGGVVAATIDGNDGMMSSSYSRNIEEMINRVLILNDKGTKQTGEVENASQRKKYGTLQGAYKKERDKNAKTEAEKLLKGVKQSASIEVFGDIGCIAGKAVILKNTMTGLHGKYIIMQDTHTLDRGLHTMQLSLYFKE